MKNDLPVRRLPLMLPLTISSLVGLAIPAVIGLSLPPPGLGRMLWATPTDLP